MTYISLMLHSKFSVVTQNISFFITYLTLNKYGKSILLAHVLANEVYTCMDTTKHLKH